MLGTKMIPEMLVIFNQVTQQIDWEEFIKITLQYSEHLEKLSCEEVNSVTLPARLLLQDMLYWEHEKIRKLALVIN